MSETTMLARARRQTPDRDSPDKIRRHEVSRVLRKMDLSPEEEEDIERLGYSLVNKIVLGPISEAMACVEFRVFYGGRSVDQVLSTSEAPSSEIEHNR